MTTMGGWAQTFWRVKTGAGEYISRVTHPNGECSQNLVSNPDNIKISVLTSS